MNKNAYGTRTFIVTKEHKRFSEFANAVRKYRYIGICFGPAGVGKTLSARRYAKWDDVEPLLTTWGKRDPSDAKVYATLSRTRTLFYTPTVSEPIPRFKDELGRLASRINISIEQHLNTHPNRYSDYSSLDLIIIDESERLSNKAIEYLRDLFDRYHFGLIFIGMPGIEKQMARYPQLYSRIGFAHHYRALKGNELTFILTKHWKKLGLTLDEADFTDTQAMAAIARITGGNFRLLNRVLVQIERILKINELNVISNEVVEAACSTLVIGAT